MATVDEADRIGRRVESALTQRVPALGEAQVRVRPGTAPTGAGGTAVPADTEPDLTTTTSARTWTVPNSTTRITTTVMTTRTATAATTPTRTRVPSA